MSKRTPTEDATYDLLLLIEEIDVRDAIQKTKESCGPGETNSFGCSMEVGFLRQHPEFKAVRVDATCVTAVLWDENKPRVRWILERDGKKIADINDLNKEQLLKSQFPIIVRFISPIAYHPGEDETIRMKRYTRSLTWGRSEEGKQAKRDSAGAREGMERGPYQKPQGKWRDGRSMHQFYTGVDIDENS